MDQNVRIRTAQIIGRSHLLSGKNRQDALKAGSVEVAGETVFYGVVCDGCSEGRESEVGANLAASFLARQIEMLAKSRIPAVKIPQILHKRTIGFLKGILGKITFDSAQARVNYIKDNLLFTILAFIYTKKETVVFAQGDGTFIVDDQVTTRDENDMPSYIGYALVDRKFLLHGASALQENFDVYLFPGPSFSRLAITSDALNEEPDFLNELWGYTHPIGLQRRVNVWSLQDHKFQDDLSIITLEVLPKEE
jgi:hypothetical protein